MSTIYSLQRRIAFLKTIIEIAKQDEDETAYVDANILLAELEDDLRFAWEEDEMECQVN